jgi:hypothetical protein
MLGELVSVGSIPCVSSTTNHQCETSHAKVSLVRSGPESASTTEAAPLSSTCRCNMSLWAGP